MASIMFAINWLNNDCLHFLDVFTDGQTVITWKIGHRQRDAYTEALYMEML